MFDWIFSVESSQPRKNCLPRGLISCLLISWKTSMKNSLFLFPQCNILTESDGNAEPYLSGSYEEFVTALISLYGRPWCVCACVCGVQVCVCAHSCSWSWSFYRFFPEMHTIHLFLPLYRLGRNKIFLTTGLKVICMILAQSCKAQTGMAQVWTLCEAHLFDVPEPRNPLYCFEGLRRHLGFN